MRALLIGFAIVGTGCVAKDGGDGLLTRDQAKSAGDALGNGIEDSAKSFGPMTAGATLDAQCTTASGNTMDPDGDSIPTSATITYNCTAMALGYTGMLTGTETVVDDQPGALAWSFSVTADLHASLVGPGGGAATITRDWDGTIVAAQTTAVGPYSLTRTLDAVTVFRSGGDLGPPRTSTVTEANDWVVTYTPMVMWTPGMLTVTGKLSATGTWIVDTDGTKADAMLSTPTPLTLDPACATGITAGLVKGTYGEGHEITVTWTACGQRTVTST